MFFNCRCRHEQVIAICKRVFVLAHATIFVRNVQRFFIIIVEAHAAVFILPRRLNPVAPTIHVMECRNSTRAVRHRCDFQRSVRHSRHRNLIADRILNLLNQHLRGFRRILRRRIAHQRKRHSIVALVGNRDVFVPDFQRQRQTGLIRILLWVIFVLLEEVFRTVAVRVHELHFAVVQHLMQRLMQRSPPAVAHAELVFVAVARIVIVRNRDGQTIAIHRGVRVGEDQVAVDKADTASPCQASRLMVVSQIALQPCETCVLQHEIRLIRRFARMKLRKAAFAFGRAQLNTVIFAQIPLARKAGDVELFPRILIFQHAAVVLIHAADIRLVVIGDCLRIPVLQHFRAHDSGICRRCVDVANAQLRGRDEVIRAQTRQVHNLQVGQTVAVVIRVADPQPLVVRKVLRRTFLNVGIEDAHGRIRRIIREHRNRAVCLRRHLLALFGRQFHPTGALPRRTREPAWSAPLPGNGCCPARTPCRSGCGDVSVPAEPGTESVPDCFLGYSYVSFLFCALLWRTFFLSNGTKKAPRAVRGSFSASFDGMILAHFIACASAFLDGRL